MTKAELAAAVRACIDVIERSGATPDEAIGIGSAAGTMAAVLIKVSMNNTEEHWQAYDHSGVPMLISEQGKAVDIRYRDGLVATFRKASEVGWHEPDIAAWRYSKRVTQ